MCRLAVAGTAASLEMSCVTIIFLLLGEAGCTLGFANSPGLPPGLVVWPQGFGKPIGHQAELPAPNPASCRNGCLLIPARRVSLFKHLWLPVAMGWMRVSARATAGVLTPVFQSCAVASLLWKGFLFSLWQPSCLQANFCGLSNTANSLSELWASTKSQDRGRRPLSSVSCLKGRFCCLCLTWHGVPWDLNVVKPRVHLSWFASWVPLHLEGLGQVISAQWQLKLQVYLDYYWVLCNHPRKVCSLCPSFRVRAADHRCLFLLPPLV